jgi:hypothetical protein
MPIVLSWIVPAFACIPSSIVFFYTKNVAVKEHQSIMSSFPGPKTCMKISEDCEIKPLMWEWCAYGRTKGLFTEIKLGI